MTNWKREGEYLGWKAWYADGTTYNSAAHRWDLLPASGIQALAFYERKPPRGKVYKTVVCGVTYDPSLYTVPGALVAKVGTMIDEREYTRIVMAAMNDKWVPGA